MDAIKAELHRLELSLGTMLKQIEEGGHPIKPQRINDLSKEIANYNKNINLFLKAYATIQACVDNIVQEAKIHAKATLQYSYDFISAVLDILKFIELRDRLDTDKHKLVQEFLSRKSELIETNYYPTAKQELEMFYDRSVRDLMERDLAKRIAQRYN